MPTRVLYTGAGCSHGGPAAQQVRARFPGHGGTAESQGPRILSGDFAGYGQVSRCARVRGGPESVPCLEAVLASARARSPASTQEPVGCTDFPCT